MSNWKKFKKFFHKSHSSEESSKPVKQSTQRFGSVDNIYLRSKKDSKSYSNFRPVLTEFQEDFADIINDLSKTHKKEFKNYTIREIRAFMENVLNNEVDFENLKINQIKQLMTNDFSNEHLVGSMTIKSIKEKFDAQIGGSNFENLKLCDLIHFLHFEDDEDEIVYFPQKSTPTKPSLVRIPENDEEKTSFDVKISKSNAAATKLDDSVYDKDICKICIENQIDCVFVECGHLMSCLKCSQNLEKCPFCRQTIYKIVKIYRV